MLLPNKMVTKRQITLFFVFCAGAIGIAYLLATRLTALPNFPGWAIGLLVAIAVVYIVWIFALGESEYAPWKGKVKTGLISVALFLLAALLFGSVL